MTKGHLVVAAVLTAVLPAALGFAMYRSAPSGCDTNAWLCLFPISMFYLAPAAAVYLPVLFYLNRRRRRPLPDGLMPVALLTGVVTQFLASGVSLWSLADYMRRIHVHEVLIFPQALAAGIVIGAVFRLSLAVLSKLGPASR